MDGGKKEYCSMCYKRWKKWNWSLIFSIIAFLLSLFAAFQCDKRIEADWMSVLVGILSLLVALLVGWQIYKTIDIDRKMENVKSIARKEAESTIDNYIHVFNAKMILSYTLNRYTTADVERFIDGCIKSLDESIKGNDYSFIDNILTLLYELKDEQANQMYPHQILMQNRKSYYLSVLYSIANKNNDWKEIADYISTFKEESFHGNFIPDYVLDYYGKK